MKRHQELSVTLTPALFDRLTAESRELGIPLEWIVASLVVDSIDADVDVDGSVLV